MFYEFAGAFAGWLLMLTTQFFLGDALGLLGKPFGNLRQIINKIANQQVWASAYAAFKVLFTHPCGLPAASAPRNSR
jgi:hypothetical protein